MAGHIATAKDTSWTTPLPIVARVREALDGYIMLDPCSNEYSVVGARHEYRLPEKDGLVETWTFASIFCNPPFGRSYLHLKCNNLVEKYDDGDDTGFFNCPQCGLIHKSEVQTSTIADWVELMAGANRVFGSEVIGLIPAATGTKHFHQFVWAQAQAVCFVKGRIKFGGAPDQGKGNVALMDCCLPYWGEYLKRFEDAFTTLGRVVRL